MEAKEIKELLARYYEGTTSLAEEQRLQTYFGQNDVPADLHSEWNQFRALANVRTEDPIEAGDHDRLLGKIVAGEQLVEQQRYRWKQWTTQVAAGVALAVTGFMGGIWYGQVTTTTQVAALREEFRTMHQTLLSTQLQQASASGRIQAIQASYASDDLAVGEALVSTLATDPNVNVRLAAIEALGRFSDQAAVREALATTLRRQDHPLVQLAIINLLVSWDEKKAVPELQRLVQSEPLDPVVRQQAEYGISQLLL